MTSTGTELEQLLIARIEREGPITFRAFMQAALYDPNYGYYNTERLKIGPEGDYNTSSNVHPAFGAVLARTFAKLWSDLSTNCSQPMTIVEMGAGTGQLACDVLTALRNQRGTAFSGADFVISETSRAMLRQQRKRLEGFDVRWCGLDELEQAPITGIFFSNELVDSMPVHRVRFSEHGLEEQYVRASGGNLTLSWGEPSTPRFADYVGRAAATACQGQIVELNLDAIDWLAQVSRAISKGFLVTIDYGDLSELLYGPDRRHGTLRSFYRHRLTDSPLERVGEQDITASVNFTALTEYGRDFGFETVSYERQVAFLLRMGLIDMIAERETSNPSREALEELLALKTLFVPGGVSDNFRVLIQQRV